MHKLLYVIGNGFDLSHKLPTKYSDFHKYISNNDNELLTKLNRYFRFEEDENCLWCNIEKNLDTFDSRYFYDYNKLFDEMSDSFKPSMLYAFEDTLNLESEKIIDSLYKQLYNWIKQIDCNKASYVKKYIDPNAIFLNFNYTRVLEDIYNVPENNIIHIHGVIGGGKLIFGHNGSNNYTDFNDNCLFSEAKEKS